MVAYVIADVEITNPVEYEDYKRMVPATLEAFGGKFVARGGEVAVLEGAWRPNRLVIIEFESVERARAWWASEEYRAAKELRQQHSVGSLVVVEGV